MTTSLYPAEFIFPGHPDKLCDAIADGLVAAAIERESRALVGVEVAVHRSHVYVTGRIACQCAEGIDAESVVRDVYRSAGYQGGWQPASDQVSVISNLCLGSLEEGEAEFRELSDDQAICIGFSNDLEATQQLPVEQWLVQRLARRMNRLRWEQPELELGPDGKVFIIVAEEIGLNVSRWKLDAFSTSLQQRAGSDTIALHRAVRIALQAELGQAALDLPGLEESLPDSLTVNGAGDFDVGGPEGDNGLSGKKLVVDAYGPRVPIGGGAWSGKDFFKADRAGGLHARRVARSLVRMGLAREAQVVLGWFPGDREARVLRVSNENGQGLDAQRIASMFDLSLLRSGTCYPQGDLVEMARWGHFFRPEAPWERFDRL